MWTLLYTLIALGLPACGLKHKKKTLARPSVFEEVTNADLRPTGPTRNRNGNAHATWASHTSRPTAPEYQRYPGNDSVTASIPKGKGLIEAGDGYELNFANASLPELAKIVLKDTLGIPYVYDERVRGQVTIATARPVSRDDLLAILESVLRMNRGVMVNEGGVYQIMPLGEAKIGEGTVSYREEASQIGAGYGITIFPLRHVSADTMMQMLAAFVAKPGTLRAEAQKNLLLIRGTGQERQSLMRVAQQFDVDWIKGQSVGIYTLRNAAPEDVIMELEQIFQTKTAGLGKNVIRFKPIERLNAVLVMTPRSKLLRKAETWVTRLDRTNNATIRTFVYKVENMKAIELANVLNKAFNGQQVASRSAADEVTPQQPAIEVSGAAQEEPQPLNERSDQLAPNDQQAALVTGSTDAKRRELRIVADEVNNKLLIKTSGQIYKKVIGLLRDLDRAPAQVLINATLAEVTLNDNLRYGVQAFLKNFADTKDRTLGFTNGTSLVIQPQFPGLNFLAGLESSPKVVLDMLANETSVRVVSSPSVVVVNNKPATLVVGDEVPISTRQATSVTDPEAPIVNNIEFRDTGVILKVTPRVNSSGLVTMEVEQEVSNVKATPAIGDAGTLTPTIAQRRIASTISVYSGQMVVLGGLISERKDLFKNRVPIWEKVPLIGRFPGGTDNASVRTELVVFLRPHVIHNSVEASLIAEELRSRLKSLSPRRKRKYERWRKRGWRTSTVHHTD